MRHELDSLPDYVYPGDEWRFVEKGFHPDALAQAETFFSTSNGYLGLRGSFEEGAPGSESGTFINGFHESWPIFYPEEAYGLARTGQTIVHVTDGTVIKLYVDDEPFYLPTARLLSYERALDMRTGTLDRAILWETPVGKRVSITSRRLVSFEERHVAAISYEVTVLDAHAPVEISSELVYRPTAVGDRSDPRETHDFTGRVLVPRVHRASDRRVVLGHATDRSKMTLAAAMENVFETECGHASETDCSDDQGRVLFRIDARPGKPIRLLKYLAYHSSRRAPVEELCRRAEHSLDRVTGKGFGSLLEDQRRHVAEFWQRADVQVDSRPARVQGHAPGPVQMQQALRFNLFHLLQASARAEGAGIPAKGLTGSGYEGHYFWDTEIYVMPFLTYTTPRVARNLLRFRFGFLDEARERAHELSQKGALFPWRTIAGAEASAYYASGTAQYHINADIVYALRQYVNATGDTAFLFEEGAEVLLETARLWRDLGFFSEQHDGRFCIVGVTGPDEYNTVVNNNLFTNLMARENLRYAAETLERLREQYPEHFARLSDERQLEAREIAGWREAADAMYLPYDEQRGIHLQDDGFLSRKPWTFEEAPPASVPLLLRYHPLVIYRHRVIKQADVILAMLLLNDEFSADEKRRNFDFYDPLTSGDSSLSSCIQSIVANEVGHVDQAVEYARYALLMDLADVGGNVKDGLHMASMGGTWMVSVYGFAGFRDSGGRFRFDPRPSQGLERLRFHLTLRGQLLRVDMTREQATYTLRAGHGLVIWHSGEEVRLGPDTPVRMPIEAQPS